MANTENELRQSLEIFDKTLPGEILASEVKDHTSRIILSMVQLKKHRDALSLQLHNPLRSLPYVKDEVVVFENKLYKAVGDKIEGNFNPVFWEEIPFTGSGDSLLTRTIFGHQFVEGNLAYYNTITNEYKKAVANADALINDSFSLFVVTNVSGNEVTFGGPGTMLPLNISGLIPSAIYLSEEIEGGLQDSIPSTPFYQQVGFYADGIFHFNPAPVKITNPTPNAVNESLELNGTTLQLRDSISTLQVDLSSLNSGANFKVDITGHLFMKGDLAYFDQATATYQKAIANVNAVTNDSFALFLVLDVMGPDVTFGIIGSVLEIDLGFSGSPVLYLSDSVEGTVTETLPNTLPYQQIGYYADGHLFFNPIPIKVDEGAVPGSLVVEQVAHGFAVGDAIYYDGTTWQKAIADASAILNDTLATNIVVTVIDSDNFAIIINGIVRADLGITTFGSLYLSQTTPGTFTREAPLTGIYQQVGWYDGENIYFNYEAAIDLDTQVTRTIDSFTIETPDYKMTRHVKGNHVTVLVKVKTSSEAKTFGVELIPAGLFDFFGFSSYYQTVDNDLPLGAAFSQTEVTFNKLMVDEEEENFGLNHVKSRKGGYEVLQTATHTSRSAGESDPGYYGDSKLPMIDSVGLQLTINHAGATDLEYSFILEGLVWKV